MSPLILGMCEDTMIHLPGSSASTDILKYRNFMTHDGWYKTVI